MAYQLPRSDLRGRTAIVTGGAGLLGRQFVETLASAGASVVSFDLRDFDVLSITEEVRTRVQSLIVDTTNEYAVARAFDAIAAEQSPTILVNGAGIDARPDASASDHGPLETYPAATWDAVLDSHLKSAFLVSREFFRELPQSVEDASIINISSIYGVVAPDQSVYQYRRDGGEVFYKPASYTVAKAGLGGLTKWLAEYGAQRNVRANTLILGGVYANQDERFVREYVRRTPLGRMATPTDYNGAVLFLASPESSYMTGGEITIDGGWTAH